MPDIGTSNLSTRLNLDYISSGQAQKHVTHNQAIRDLDTLVHLCVEAQHVDEPASNPQEAQAWIVGSTPSGAWQGQSLNIAAWRDGGWHFYTPKAGFSAYVKNEDVFAVYDGAVWKDIVNAGDPNGNGAGEQALLGLNALASEEERLAVKTDSVFLSHDDVRPGNGDIRLKLNKAAADKTASLLLQDDYSGRAEMGLAGDDGFAVKVSPDGNQWFEAIKTDNSTGGVSFPNGERHPQTGRLMSQLMFTYGGNGETSIYRNDTMRSATPTQAIISSVSADVLTLFDDAANLFFHPFMREVACVRVWNMSLTPVQSAWVKYDPASDQLQVTNAADISTWAGGHTLQLGDPIGAAGVPVNLNSGYALDISPMLRNIFGAEFRQSGLILRVVVRGTDTVSLALSHNGDLANYMRSFSHVGGNQNVEMVTIGTNILSPISNSNLLFISEGDAGPNTILKAALSVIGVYT